jgi:polyferredoxin
VKITNRTAQPRTYCFAMPGIAGATLDVNPPQVTLEPGETITQPVRVLLPYQALTAGRVNAHLQIIDDRNTTFDHTLILQGPTAPPEGITP